MRSLVLGLGICVVFLLGCEPPRRPVGMDPDLRPPDTTPADEATDGSEQLQEAQQERARQLAERQPRRPTEEQLQEQLRSTTPTERISAARALWRMGPNAKEAIPALIEALGDSESEVRGLAARALGQMGADASEAVPVLTKMLSDEANYAVTVLTPDTFLGGGYYMRAGSHTVYVRANAAEALRRIEPVAAETVPAFVVLLSDGEPAVRGAAARVLGRIEVGPNPAIRALALLLHDDAEYRPETEYEDPGRFVRTLGSIVVPGFATEMVRVGDNAADALAQFGPEAVLPTLKELLDDEDAQARRGAAKGLGLLRAEAKTAIPELIAALQDESWDVRLSVTEALGAIGPEAAVAVPDLIRLLVAEDSHDSRAAPVERMQQALDLRKGVAEALRKMLPDATASLTEMLHDKNNRVRSTTAYVVGEIGPEAKPAIPALAELLQDRDHQVRVAAVWALGKMGADAKQAIPELRNLLEDEKEQVRQAVGEALKAIVQLED